MRTPVHTGQFRRDIRRTQRRGKDLSKLRDVLTLLITAEPLPPRLKDHSLRGEWRGYRNLHIEPDWLLLHTIDGNDLILARTGAHADLFRQPHIALTGRQRELLKEAEAIAALTKLDYHQIEEADPEARIPLLRVAINHTVIARMVTCDTLLDELLSHLIVRYFFRAPKKQLHFGKLWRTKKFQTFNHNILDEMYLPKKMDLVHAIDPLPGEVAKTIRKVNALWNAFAHSFFPENRKEHRKSKKVLYGGKNIHTREGLELFLNDWGHAWTYLARRAFGQWHDE